MVVQYFGLSHSFSSTYEAFKSNVLTLDSHTQGSASDDSFCVWCIKVCAFTKEAFFNVSAPGGRISPWLCKTWQGFALQCRIRQNGLYPIPQGLIEQTSPFLPLSPASPCSRKEEKRESREGEQGENGGSYKLLLTYQSSALLMQNCLLSKPVAYKTYWSLCFSSV